MRKIALLMASCLLAAAWAQEKEAAKAESKSAAKPASAGAKYWNSDQGKWSDSGMAGVHSMSVSGDPAKGPSVQYLKVDPGAAVGWHWHTPAETLMGDSGTLEVQMWKSENTVKITSGSYGKMPGHMIHKAKCISNEPCTLYLESSGIFDFHAVDDKGNEIKPAAKSAKMEMKKEAKK